MLKTNWQRIAGVLLACSMAFLLALVLVSCSNKSTTVPNEVDQKSVEEQLPVVRSQQRASQAGVQISEVSPPQVIQELRQLLEGNQPQVEITSPKPDEILQDNTVLVQLKVEDLTLFKNAKLELGPHLQVFLDNQPSQAVYDLSQPLTLQDLTPGTHTLRIFAAYPWHESFKNEGAYAQTTFHIFTKTQNNDPSLSLPLLTYNRPQGNYGAEPVMLDFYLTNAPLHLVAQESPDDDITDWQIRCTIDGASFILDRWQPIYLKGFKPGKNWVQLEFLDETGNLVQNVFNRPIHLVNYEPGGKDTLSRLVKGELKAADARGIVDPNYTTETLVPTPVLSPSPSPTPSPEPSISPSPSVEVPSDTPTPTFKPSTSAPLVPSPTPTVGETPPIEIPKEQAAPKTTELSKSTEAKPEATEAEPAEAKQSRESGFRKFLNRFRRPSSDSGTPLPMPPALPEVIVTPPDGDTARSPSDTPSVTPLTPQGELLPEPSEETTPSRQIPTPMERLPSSPNGPATPPGQAVPSEVLRDRQQPETQELQPSVTSRKLPTSAD